MRYDIKVYEGREEMETIRDLKESQVIAITKVFDRHGIRYSVKLVETEESRSKE